MADVERIGCRVEKLMGDLPGAVLNPTELKAVTISEILHVEPCGTVREGAVVALVGDSFSPCEASTAVAIPDNAGRQH